MALPLSGQGRKEQAMLGEGRVTKLVPTIQHPDENVKQLIYKVKD